MNTRQPDSRYTKRLTILLTPEQHEALSERAFRQKISVGELARDALFSPKPATPATDTSLELRVAALEREINLLRDKYNSVA